MFICVDFILLDVVVVKFVKPRDEGQVRMVNKTKLTNNCTCIVRIDRKLSESNREAKSRLLRR